MIFYPICGNPDLKLLDDPKLFNAQYTDPFCQQGFIGQPRGVPADPWLDNEPTWLSTEHRLSSPQLFQSRSENKMGSLPQSYVSGEPRLENELIWLHQKSSESSNPNSFSGQYCSFIDNERNNNINFKSLLNFSLKNSDCFEEEDEKENLMWIPTSIQSGNVSLSNNVKSSPLLINQKSVSSEKNAEEPQRRCYTSSTLSPKLPYNKNDSAFAYCSDDGWKNKLKWQGDEQQQILTEHRSDQQQEQRSQIAEVNPQHTVVPNIPDQESTTAEESGDVEVESEEEQNNIRMAKSGEKEQSPSKKDEMDTLLTFLSKFDDKVAAIWGHNIGANKNFENLVNTNPWNNSAYVTSELLNFQQIEDENVEQLFDEKKDVTKLVPSHPLLAPISSATNGTPQQSSAKGKHTIMNSMKQYFGSAPSESEYFIIRSQAAGQKTNLEVLNHSDEFSGFIKFIPLLKAQPVENSYNNSKLSTFHDDKQNQVDMSGTASNLKEMLHNLELDCEDEQEIIAACSKPRSRMLTESAAEDLLTSWKTHFRTVIAQEILANANNNDCSSPIISHGNPQLPEFRTEYNEKDYVLYQRTAATAFQVRFKLCRDNEKGNQTEDISALSEFGDGFELDGHIQEPLVDYGKQLSQWLNGQYDDEGGNGFEFDWSEGRFMDSCGDSYYDDSVFDDYDNLKVTSDIDSDYGQFHSFCLSSGISGSNKQSKANRRRAKGRPCKYFFMDGSCRRGNECKFSHDLITCRFWAEGSCLKGQSCPFLHCFLDAKDFEGHGRFDPKIDTKYQLESESDFPALGSTKISSRVPIEDVNKVIDILSQDDDGLSKLEEHNVDEMSTSGWPHLENNATNNWICSLINVNEKRKKKKH